jgi:PhnB protein
LAGGGSSILASAHHLLECLSTMSIAHSYNPADGFPQIMPSLRYGDVAGALAWLTDAFGFREHLRWTDGNGVVQHAEMRVGEAFIELSAGSPDHPTPKALGGVSGALVVMVHDVDSHFARARARGAIVVAVPEDRPWGLRQYTVEDPDGHRWEFSQFLRHVPPQDWGATLAAPA